MNQFHSDPIYETVVLSGSDVPNEVLSLRYEVFLSGFEIFDAMESGANKKIEKDQFDIHCEHVVVLAHSEPGMAPTVIATCRILTPQGAEKAGGFYCQQLFELSPSLGVLGGLHEVSRLCVDKRYRRGHVMLRLWTAIGHICKRNRATSIIGSVSVPLDPNLEVAMGTWRKLHESRAPNRIHYAIPTIPFQSVPDFSKQIDSPSFPLAELYVRMGGELLGDPAYDKIFRTADFPMFCSMRGITKLYARRLCMT